MQTRKKPGVIWMSALMVIMLTTSCAARAAEQDALPQYAYISNQSVYFYDVDDHYPWAFHEIDYLASSDIVKGTDDFLFEPELPISRADFVLMLYRAYDMSGYRAGENFTDIPAGAYYADAVLAAKNLGIATGQNGRFRPDALITRQDAMVLLARTIARTGVTLSGGSLSSFPDAARVAGYAGDAVASLIQAGVVGGDKNGLRPTSNVSRAEMAVMLYRALMLQETDGEVHYKAHPERINLCIGDQVYSGVTIANFDETQAYGGLMPYTEFTDSGEAHFVTFGDEAVKESAIAYQNGALLVDGRATPVAQGCIAIQLAPYSILDGLVSTGQQYRYGAVSYNEDGEAAVVYYT